MKRPIGVVLSIVALVVAGACNGSDSPTVNAPTTPAAAAIVLPTLGPAADYHPVFHPADFSANIDNPWFPLKPGSTFIYTGTKDGKSAREVFAPSSQTKIIAGVPCRVLVDKLYL